MAKVKKNKQQSVFMQLDDVISNLREQKIESWDYGEILLMDEDSDVERMIDDFDELIDAIEHEVKELQELIKHKKIYATARKTYGFELSYLLYFLSSYDERFIGIMSPNGYWYNRESMVEIRKMKAMYNGRNTYLENAINFVKSLLEDIQTSQPEDCHPEIKIIITPIIEAKLKELETV